MPWQLYTWGWIAATERSACLGFVERGPLWVYALAAQQLGFHGEDILDSLVLAKRISNRMTQSLQSLTLFTRL